MWHNQKKCNEKIILNYDFLHGCHGDQDGLGTSITHSSYSRHKVRKSQGEWGVSIWKFWRKFKFSTRGGSKGPPPVRDRVKLETQAVSSFDGDGDVLPCRRLKRSPKKLVVRAASCSFRRTAHPAD